MRILIMKNRIILIIEVFLIAVILATTVYNLVTNKEYFKFNLSQTLTLIVAVVFAFSASQYKTDERKLKEQTEKLIEKIQYIVNDTSFYCFSINDNGEEIIKKNRVICRKLSNCICALEEYSKKLSIKNEVRYIKNEYKNYKELISDHLYDFEYLSKSEVNLKRYAENIDSKCVEIIVNIYK